MKFISKIHLLIVGNICMCLFNYTNLSAQQSPYNGTRTIPGVIQVEDYDLGGEGISYHDMTATNEGGVYRPAEGVDIITSTAETNPVITLFKNGEWMEYTVNVATDLYFLDIRISNPNSNRQLKVYLDGTLVSTLNVPSAGSAWTTYTMGGISLTGGNNKILKLENVNGDFDINWVAFRSMNLAYYTFYNYVSPAAGGIVTPPSGSTGGPGYTISALAIPNPGYAFTGWSGDVTGTTNPVNIVMSANRAVTANFALLPTVITNPVNPIAQTTATSGGNVTSIGSSSVTDRGVCWSTTPNPIKTNANLSAGSGLGLFTSSITGLTAGVQYYLRAYATNSVGTGYGENVQFTTLAYSWQTNSTNIYYPFGNVGIGTNPTPLFKFDVDGDIHTNTMFINDAQNASQIRLNGSGSYFGKIGNPSTQIWSLGYGTAGTDIIPVLSWTPNGSILINKTQGDPYYKLDVAGPMRADEIMVNTTVGADYVFDKDYKLPTIKEVESYINTNNHLPSIPSSKEMEKEGLSMGEFQIQLLRKIEELTLYIIELKKENEMQSKQIEELSK